MTHNTARRFLSALLLLAMLSGPLFLFPLPAAFAMPTSGLTGRVSVSSSDEQGDINSDSPSISADGRFVAFESSATNLVDGIPNETRRIFVRDRLTGTTEAVPAPSTGEEVVYFQSPSISANGRFVAFASYSTYLPGEYYNGGWNIYLHDRQTGLTERISNSPSGEQGNEISYGPSISANGRFVVFTSKASNLVSGDTNFYCEILLITNNENCADVFVYDRETGLIERISVSSTGEEGNESSEDASISVDGRFVVFTSRASNLVDGDTNHHSDIFVHDRQTSVTRRISVSSSGEQGDFASASPSISADGRFVVFTSYAMNLVSGDTNLTCDNIDGGPLENCADVFVYDRQTGVTERISLTSGGEQGDSHSYNPSISSDGRFVAFESDAANLVQADTNEQTDIFLHDRQTGKTGMVSVSSSGEQGNFGSTFAFISGSGRFVTFATDASNLVSEDTNGVSDVFVYDHCPDSSCAPPYPMFLPFLTLGISETT